MNDTFNFRKRLEIENPFLILFSGNHGLAQGLEHILAAAALLKEYPDIIFVFVGDGVKKTQMVALKNKLNLHQVHFVDKKPREEMPELISDMNLCLVPLIRHKLFLHALPSKMFEYMACSKPLIVSILGEAESFVDNAKCGICVQPEDSNALKEAILHLYNNRYLIGELGSNGRAYIIEHYTRKALGRRLENRLKQLF